MVENECKTTANSPATTTDQILSLVCKRIEGAKWTEKQIKQDSYKAECDLEDMYSRHETCQDKFGCTPMEYIEKAKMQAQRQAIIDVIKEE